jgi:hypothetical protein
MRLARKSPLVEFGGLEIERTTKLLERERAALFLLAGVLVLLIAAESLSAIMSGPRLLPAWLIGLGVTIFYSLYHLYDTKRSLRELQREIDGERRLHAQLAGLAVLGVRVFTNVPTGHRTIDLVILSQHGAFACDVKLAQRAPGAILKVVVDADRLRVDGTTITPNPLQLIAEDVQLLQGALRIGRTDDIIVRPLIVITGCDVEVERRKDAPEVGVVSARGLEEFMKARPEELSVTELTMHAVRLAAHVREHVGDEAGSRASGKAEKRKSG